MTAIPYLVENDYPWLKLIAAKGDEGALWAKEYRRPEITALYGEIIRSLKLMGKGKVEEALVVLQEVRRQLDELSPSLSASVECVINCWYYGALAYYHYCREEFPLAEQTLLRGHAEIRRGVELQRVILPMVYRCCDTWLHRSRIARSQHDWTAMREHLDHFRAIHRGDEPFCTLEDGTSISAADLERYIAELGLGESELADSGLREYADVFCNRENRRRYSDYFAEAIYLLPWLPIRY